MALLGFTSGTTDSPKAMMHFHRDLLIIADGYATKVPNVTSDDVFVGSQPLAFTFGLGGLAVFLLRFGAAECAVIGVPDDTRCAIVQTHVVIKYMDLQTPLPRRFWTTSNRSSPYKYPRSIVFCDELPITRTGKILRFLL